MIPAGHMQKCLWARAQNLPVQRERNTARSSLVPETAGVACSREGEEMEIFIKKPPFSVTFVTSCANESKSHMEYSPMAVALYPADGRGEPGRRSALSRRGWGNAAPGPGWSCCSHMSPPQTAALALTLERAGTVWEVGLVCIYRVNPAAH